jgi:hypothetical protein
MPWSDANRMRIGRSWSRKQASLVTTGPGWQSKAQKNGRAFNASVIKVRIDLEAVNPALLSSPRL